MDGNRESVPLSKVPVHVQHALLAAEDRSFYQNKGVSPDRHRARDRRRGQGRADPGRVHDHPAVRQELLPHPGPDPDPQGQGAHHLAEDRPAEVQVRDPGRLPQHHLLRPRRLRHPDRVQGVLRQGRLPAHGRARAPCWRRSSAARASTTPRSARSRRRTRRPASNYVLDGMQAEGWLTPAQRAKATFPKVISPKAKKTKGGSIGYITADVQQELRSKLRLTDAEHRPRWPADHHHDQQAGAGRRRQGRPGQHADRPGHLHPARGPGRGRAGQRRRRRDVRRQGLHQGPAQLRHRRDDAGRVDVQAVRR